MTRVHTDLSSVPISVAPDPATSGTTLGVTDANAAYLPDTYPYWATLVPTGATPTRANSEIVKVTGGSSAAGTTTLTIVRAQGIPVTTAQTVTTSFDIYDANATEALSTTVAIVSGEVPGGTINSSNVDFTSASSMATGSLKVYQNGVRMKGGGVDFTQGTGTAFSFVTAPTTGDIILIDYQTSAGIFSSGSTSFVYNETPSGLVNGSNTAYDTASTYVAGSIQVYRDGQLMKGGGADYTETDSNTITFTTAPVTGSVLLVTYQSAVSTVGNADTLDSYHANATPTASNIPVLDSSARLPYPDGWTPAVGTWTYASASTITVPSGAAAIYQKGDRIKWTQTTVKYGVITAVADTTLTIAVNTDYTVADAAISANYYSHQINPIGYPNWFATAAPTFNVSFFDNGSGGQPTTSQSRISINGNTCFAHWRGNGTKAGTQQYIVFTHSIYPAIANYTDRSCIGSAYCGANGADGDLGNPGSVATISGSDYITLAHSINDNLTIDNASFILTYEI